jgi:beta-glucosidase
VVTVTLENTGNRSSEEVVQVYVGKPDSTIERQHKLLKGFEKIALEAGQAVKVEISVPTDELRYYDGSEQRWRLETGTYTFHVGGSSNNDELLKADIVLR